MYVYIYICVCACVYTWLYMYIYIYIYKQYIHFKLLRLSDFTMQMYPTHQSVDRCQLPGHCSPQRCFHWPRCFQQGYPGWGQSYNPRWRRSKMVDEIARGLPERAKGIEKCWENISPLLDSNLYKCNNKEDMQSGKDIASIQRLRQYRMFVHLPEEPTKAIHSLALHQGQRVHVFRQRIC